jgi:hypothetical protein
MMKNYGANRNRKKYRWEKRGKETLTYIKRKNISEKKPIGRHKVI